MISEEEVKNIAKLSYLKISDDELKKFQNDFSAILDYVNKLDELNVESIEETSNLAISENVFRPDVDRLFDNEDLIKLMPHKKDNYLEVKKILNND